MSIEFNPPRFVHSFKIGYEPTHPIYKRLPFEAIDEIIPLKLAKDFNEFIKVRAIDKITEKECFHYYKIPNATLENINYQNPEKKHLLTIILCILLQGNLEHDSKKLDLQKPAESLKITNRMIADQSDKGKKVCAIAFCDTSDGPFIKKCVVLSGKLRKNRSNREQSFL